MFLSLFARLRRTFFTAWRLTLWKTGQFFLFSRSLHPESGRVHFSFCVDKKGGRQMFKCVSCGDTPTRCLVQNISSICRLL